MLIDWTGEAAAVGAALAAGLLIGIERGWKQRGEKPGSRIAGVRTFTLLGLGAGIAGLVGARGYSLAAGALIAGGVGLMTYAFGRELKAQRDSTTAVAALLTLAIGFLGGSGNAGLAIAAAAITISVLALKAEIHGFLERLDEEDVKALARFSVIALAVLPFLPDQPFGPYDAWNASKLSRQWLSPVTW